MATEPRTGTLFTWGRLLLLVAFALFLLSAFGVEWGKVSLVALGLAALAAAGLVG